MKLKLTLLTLLIGLVANARFEKAIILFKDGHTENGYVKWFVSNSIVDGLSSVESTLNLDEKRIDFKTTEDAEIKKFESDDIDEITFILEDGKSLTFKRILLKELTSKGKIKDKGKMVFLPYVKKGAINIFGIGYKEVSGGGPGAPRYFGSDMRFYYQNAKENYAIDYQNIGMMDMFHLKSRFTNPLKDLFKDCPKMVKALEESELSFLNSQGRQETREKEKEFNDLPKEERATLANFHKYKLYAFEQMFDEYANCK